MDFRTVVLLWKFKQKNKTTVQKSKALRKELITCCVLNVLCVTKSVHVCVFVAVMKLLVQSSGHDS